MLFVFVNSYPGYLTSSTLLCYLLPIPYIPSDLTLRTPLHPPLTPLPVVLEQRLGLLIQRADIITVTITNHPPYKVHTLGVSPKEVELLHSMENLLGFGFGDGALWEGEGDCFVDLRYRC